MDRADIIQWLRTDATSVDREVLGTVLADLKKEELAMAVLSGKKKVVGASPPKPTYPSWVGGYDVVYLQVIVDTIKTTVTELGGLIDPQSLEKGRDYLSEMRQAINLARRLVKINTYKEIHTDFDTLKRLVLIHVVETRRQHIRRKSPIPVEFDAYVRCIGRLEGYIENRFPTYINSGWTFMVLFSPEIFSSPYRQ